MKRKIILILHRNLNYGGSPYPLPKYIFVYVQHQRTFLLDNSKPGILTSFGGSNIDTLFDVQNVYYINFRLRFFPCCKAYPTNLSPAIIH